MFDYDKMISILKEFGNVSASINAYESPAKPFNVNKNLSKINNKETKPIDWNKRLKQLHKRRGENVETD
jgi:hypothetical protein